MKPENLIFHDDELIVHCYDKDYKYSVEILDGGYPIYVKVVEIDSGLETNDEHALFFPITEREFNRKDRKSRSFINKAKADDDFIGFMLMYSIEVSPRLKLVGKSSEHDVYDAIIVFSAVRFDYYIDNHKVYVTNIRDVLYPTGGI